MRRIIILISIVYFSITITPVIQAQQIKGSKNEAMFRADSQNTGVYETEGCHELPELRWKFKANGMINGAPVIYNGMVYFGTNGGSLYIDGHFYAIDTETGQENWKYTLTHDYRPIVKVMSPPAVSEGVVYSGTNDGYLLAFDALTGKEKWSLKTKGKAIAGSPIVSGKSIYFNSIITYRGSGNEYLYSVDKQLGKEKWIYAFNSESIIVPSSPAIAEGVIYLIKTKLLELDFKSHLCAFDEEIGKPKWNFALGEFAQVPVVSNEVVYTGSGGNLYAIDSKTGQEKWKLKTGKEISLLCVTNSTLYFGSGNHLYALNVKTGQEVWKFETEKEVSYPCVADGIVYFGAGNYLYALDEKKGQMKWKYHAECPVDFLAIGDGIICFGSEYDSYIYAVR